MERGTLVAQSRRGEADFRSFDGPLGVGSPKRARAGRRRRYIADGFFIVDDESRDIECGFVTPASRAAGEA